MVGCFLSLLRNAANNNKCNLKFEGDSIIFQGQLSFVNALDAENQITDWIKENKSEGGKITLDVTNLTYIDVDASDVFMNLLKKYPFGGDTQIDFEPSGEYSSSVVLNEEWYTTYLNGEGKAQGNEEMCEGGDDDFQRYL